MNGALLRIKGQKNDLSGSRNFSANARIDALHYFLTLNVLEAEFSCVLAGVTFHRFPLDEFNDRRRMAFHATRPQNVQAIRPNKGL